MKTLALAVGMFALFIVGSAGSAHAQPYGMAGCGLGSIAFGNDQTMFKQVLAATTNGTFGTQTFGITSGTSNCVSGGDQGRARTGCVCRGQFPRSESQHGGGGR